MLLLLTLISGTTFAASTLSLHSILSFECVTQTTAGISKLSFSKDHSPEVSAVRNSFLRSTYRLNSAGEIRAAGTQYLTLMGDRLGGTNALALIGPRGLESGNNTWSGQVYLTSVSGSVFAPISTGAYPIGTFRCESIVLR